MADAARLPSTVLKLTAKHLPPRTVAERPVRALNALRMASGVMTKYLEYFAGAPEVMRPLLLRFLALLFVSDAEIRAELDLAIAVGVRALVLADVVAAARLCEDLRNLSSGARVPPRRGSARVVRASHPSPPTSLADGATEPSLRVSLSHVPVPSHHLRASLPAARAALASPPSALTFAGARAFSFPALLAHARACAEGCAEEDNLTEAGAPPPFDLSCAATRRALRPAVVELLARAAPSLAAFSGGAKTCADREYGGLPTWRALCIQLSAADSQAADSQGGRPHSHAQPAEAPALARALSCWLRAGATPLTGAAAALLAALARALAGCARGCDVQQEGAVGLAPDGDDELAPLLRAVLRAAHRRELRAAAGAASGVLGLGCARALGHSRSSPLRRGCCVLLRKLAELGVAPPLEGAAGLPLCTALAGALGDAALRRPLLRCWHALLLATLAPHLPLAGQRAGAQHWPRKRARVASGSAAERARALLAQLVAATRSMLDAATGGGDGGDGVAISKALAGGVVGDGVAISEAAGGNAGGWLVLLQGPR
ncbi:hypothetical protein T492DRAFT_850103 [Pavlovales sp. CCMP2436]|nr:hypothetical protein T492DRAFT_850103 [Pavlovales sp. CCMP2436]